MRVLFDGPVFVTYAQLYVASPSRDTIDLTACLRGQSNGLCGAGMAGSLYLVTGLHTGMVTISVELWDVAPPEDPLWEDVVEVSFRPRGLPVTLAGLESVAAQLDLVPIDYRARYSVSGMDGGSAQDTRMEGDPVTDRYLLQFWPARPAPDRVLRTTSAKAVYWHDYARTIEPVPAPPATDDVTNESQRRARRHEALRYENLLWVGRIPSQRARNAPNVEVLARTERDLVHGLDRLDDETLRTIARWAAHRAYAAAGLTTVPWASDLLESLDQGRTLPDIAGAWMALARDGEAARDHANPTVPQQHLALPAPWSAALPDPLHAALGALADAVATFGTDRPDLLAELRTAFPVLR